MSARRIRLNETIDAVAGPLARLGSSLRNDEAAVLKAECEKSAHDLLATDAFLQRFQQATDLTLRKLFPRLLAVLEDSDVKHPFGAVLDRLDGYRILSDVSWWIELNELRNRLIHEYAMSTNDRAAEIGAAWRSATVLRAETKTILEDRIRRTRSTSND